MPKKQDRTRKPVKKQGFKRKVTTRSQTKPARDAAIALKRQQALAAAAALAQRRAQALAARPAPPLGSAGDRQLHIAFIRVGQGDCAIMTTPQGRVLLFDCGSDSKEGEVDDMFVDRVQTILSGPKFLAASDTIDILITTHPDTDHYNQLAAVLGDAYTIGTWYFSAARADYAQAQTSGFILDHLANEETGFKKVVLNHDPGHGAAGAVTINGAAVQPAGGGVTVDRLDGNGGIRIVDEPTCKISILAADVNHVYTPDSSNPTNRGSVVTLVEANNAKVLMCGDATVNTERYLLNVVPAARLQNLNVVQAGHHGSVNTSSSQAFVDRVNPQMVIASAGKQIPMHHLPSEAVITRYRDRLQASGRTQIPEHETFYYQAGGFGGYFHTSSFNTYPVFTTGSRDTVYITIPAPV